MILNKLYLDEYENKRYIILKHSSRNFKHKRPKTTRYMNKSKYTKNAPARWSSEMGDTNSASKRKFKKPKWNENKEELFQTHKVDIINRLSKNSSIVPWNDVIMGSFDNISKNSYYKGRYDQNRKSQVLIDKELMLDTEKRTK